MEQFQVHHLSGGRIKKEERKERNREEAHLRVFPEAPLWMPFSAVQQLLDTARSPGCSRCSANLL